MHPAKAAFHLEPWQKTSRSWAIWRKRQESTVLEGSRQEAVGIEGANGEGFRSNDVTGWMPDDVVLRKVQARVLSLRLHRLAVEPEPEASTPGSTGQACEAQGQGTFGRCL
ncbi:unnamed protein product [Caenorhabditis auriculariae]|uniref:Uncharacterized protein n=1 Tax=Caenorhabditis auriculariae TaxID=2777116 RepID=A0A8S1H3S6_9PELO|nr:unnamed protein product [Caenorhabditis auriculariae]